jgi:hypothetical protein
MQLSTHNPELDKEYVLIDIKENESKLNITKMYRLRWYCINDNMIYDMTVDNTFRNWHTNGWKNFTQMPNPYGLYKNLKPITRKTNNDLPVLTADTTPILIEKLHSKLEALILAEEIATAVEKTSTYTDLFK